MNTHAPLFNVLSMLKAAVDLLKIAPIRHPHTVAESCAGLLYHNSKLKNAKAGSFEHKVQDGAS